MTRRLVSSGRRFANPVGSQKAPLVVRASVAIRRASDAGSVDTTTLEKSDMLRIQFAPQRPVVWEQGVERPRPTLSDALMNFLP